MQSDSQVTAKKMPRGGVKTLLGEESDCTFIVPPFLFLVLPSPSAPWRRLRTGLRRKWAAGQRQISCCSLGGLSGVKKGSCRGAKSTLDFIFKFLILAGKSFAGFGGP
jgi:hypothetical protein